MHTDGHRWLTPVEDGLIRFVTSPYADAVASDRQAFACRVGCVRGLLFKRVRTQALPRPRAYGLDCILKPQYCQTVGQYNGRTYIPSRPIVSEPETASQARLQSRLGLRTPLYATGMQGTAEPWIRRRTLVHPKPPVFAPEFVWFRVFRG